jgi:hypothetical protein
VDLLYKPRLEMGKTLAELSSIMSMGRIEGNCERAWVTVLNCQETENTTIKTVDW